MNGLEWKTPRMYIAISLKSSVKILEQCPGTTQLTFTCSLSTTETPEKGLKYVYAFFYCFYIDFEQVNVSCVASLEIVAKFLCPKVLQKILCYSQWLLLQISMMKPVFILKANSHVTYLP